MIDSPRDCLLEASVLPFPSLSFFFVAIFLLLLLAVVAAALAADHEKSKNRLWRKGARYSYPF